MWPKADRPRAQAELPNLPGKLAKCSLANKVLIVSKADGRSDNDYADDHLWKWPLGASVSWLGLRKSCCFEGAS